MGCGDAVLNEERGVTWRWSEFDRFAALHGYRIKAHDVLTWRSESKAGPATTQPRPTTTTTHGPSKPVTWQEIGR